MVTRDYHNYEKAYAALVTNFSETINNFDSFVAHVMQTCCQTMDLAEASFWVPSPNEKKLVCHSLYETAKKPSKLPVKNVVPSVAIIDLKGRLHSMAAADNDDIFADTSVAVMDEYFQSKKLSSVIRVSIKVNESACGFLAVARKNANEHWLEIEKSFINAATSLIERYLLISRLSKDEEFYQALYNDTSEAIFIFSDNKIVDVNPAACRIFRCTKTDLIGNNPIQISPPTQPDGRPSAESAVQYIKACLDGNAQSFEWKHLRFDNTEFFADITLNPILLSGKSTLMAVIRDVDNYKRIERDTREQRLKTEYRATHDSLTGLESREQLHKHVASLIYQANSVASPVEVALLLFDLNRFKEINDTMGHAIGDKVLQQIAASLKSPIEKNSGRLFRIGGDEFVAVFSTAACKTPLNKLPDLIKENLQTSIFVNGLNIQMSASIGMSLYPNNGSDSNELLRCADVAMYHCKLNDDASPWYDPKNDNNSMRRLSMIVELGNAIRENELVLYFQPRVSLDTNQLTGFEALVRWQHSEHGLVPPAEFMPLAEMSDLIHTLTAWVLEAAIARIAALSDQGYEVPVAVNISTRNLTDSQLVDSIKSLLSSYRVNPSLLEIEITESSLINQHSRVLENLNRLSEMGICIAIDDFGIGYSSLSYLKKLPINMLKIDRSFVEEMLVNEPDRIIVNSTINLAHNFNLKVVAEGVQNEECLQALRQLNCDQAQGFYISEPITADKMQEQISKGRFNKPADAIA